MQLRLLPVAVLVVAFLSAPLAQGATAPAPGAQQWVDADFSIAQPDFLHVVFGGVLRVHEIPLDGHPTAALDIVKSYSAGTSAERQDLLGKITTSVQDDLEKSLAAAFPHANVSKPFVTVNPVSLTNFPGRSTYEPVNITLSDQITRSADDPAFGGLTTQQLEALFSSGAQVRSSLTLSAEPGYDAVYSIQAPNVPVKLVFSSPSQGTVSKDGRMWTFPIPNAEGATPKTASGDVVTSLPKLPNYTAQKADVGVLIDLKSLDVTLGQAVKGDFGTLNADVTVTGRINVIPVPESAKARMGSQVKLDYLSADGVRLLKASGLLTQDNLSAIESDLRTTVSQKLSSTLGQEVTVTGGLDEASLNPSVVGTVASDKNPITFTAHASFSKPLGGSSSGGASIALYTVQQAFDFPKVQSLNTTYTVVLPSGLAVKDLQVAGGAGQTGKSADGRDQFTVTPSDGSAHASVAMAVTPSFVVAKFWPVLLVALVVLVLVIGTPIALVATRRRRNKGKEP